MFRVWVKSFMFIPPPSIPPLRNLIWLFELCILYLHVVSFPRSKRINDHRFTTFYNIPMSQIEKVKILWLFIILYIIYPIYFIKHHAKHFLRFMTRKFLAWNKDISWVQIQVWLNFLYFLKIQLFCKGLKYGAECAVSVLRVNYLPSN